MNTVSINHDFPPGGKPCAIRIRVALLLLASATIILVGQVGRELLRPDDLREVEVAREMLESGDFVVPQFGGLPFVEKPSGFPAIVAMAYSITGGPSAAVARLTTAGFALATLAAVFLLGKRVMGVEEGALAVASLAISSRFCRAAHGIHIDNALASASAFVLLFTWVALEAEVPRSKGRAYSAAGLMLGVSFLIKGFVGPALLGTGLLSYLLLSRRFSELRYILRPLPVIAFFVPVLVWVVPFVMRASPSLINAFFIQNHFGRFLHAFESNRRPFYYYFLDIWPAFAPVSLLLPASVWVAWKSRRISACRHGVFFLAFAMAPVVLLSFSQAKDSIYLLPAYPALALLVTWAIKFVWAEPGNWTRILANVMATAGILAAGAAVVANGILGAPPLLVLKASIVAACCATVCVLALCRRDLRWVGVSIISLFALTWVLWFTDPIADQEVSKRSLRQPVEEVIRLADSRELLLYYPGDGLCGAVSFYRNRTASVVNNPPKFVSRLVEDPSKVAAILQSRTGSGLPAQIIDAAQSAGVVLRIEADVDFGRGHLLLIRADSTTPAFPE